MCIEKKYRFVNTFHLSTFDNHANKRPFSGIISAVCLILFGVKSDQPEVEAKWIYFPDKNFLSWSYALVAVSGFLSLFGSMCGFVAAMTARLEDKYGERPNYDGHMLRSQPTVY